MAKTQQTMNFTKDEFKNSFSIIQNTKALLNNLFHQNYIPRTKGLGFVEVSEIDDIGTDNFLISLRRYYANNGTADYIVINIPYKMILGEMSESEIKLFFNNLD
jgi:hypothetical protein